ncbi:aminopeptidase [Metabacillus fastidiosus]|uniref:aminopeptidase n=1 Tax=Metabacillus fastidiosus TaxID=1458 RepID=UPI003D279D88
MAAFEEKIQKYAELAVKVGVNIQKGQTLVIFASISAVDFVRKLSRIAYENGAGQVYIEWSDEKLQRLECELASEEVLTNIPMWKIKGYEKMAGDGAAFLYVLSPYIDNMEGIDPDRINLVANAVSEASRHFMEGLISMQVAWSVVAIPTVQWAKKVFPQLESKEGIVELWESIFHATRIDCNNPVTAWKEHLDGLNEKTELLNNRSFRFLHFKGPGTNLTIELPKNHLWVNGLNRNVKGTPFICNLPTEEVYTTPLKTGVNGTVQITKPLVYDGQLIDGFTLTFEKGRIIDFSAKSGYEQLKQMISTDEGTRYIGEVALVPHHSPISISNLIYYHTLFDENAACHIAIGHAYTTGLKDGGMMTTEEREENNINSSLIHIDVMIGQEQLQVDGEREDGEIEPIFLQGNWTEYYKE